MQGNRLSSAARKLSFLVVAMILLLSAFQAAGLGSAHAQEPLPGAPTPLAPKTPPPGVDVSTADVSVTATADSYEPDNTQAELDGNASDVPLTTGVGQTHSISPVGDIDYVKFVLPPSSGKYSVTLQISPANWLDDTEMWLYDSGGTLIDYNDDMNPNVSQSYIQRCGTTALSAGTYYAAVDKRGNDVEIASYTITFTINSGCIPNTAVNVSAQNKGRYWVHPETSTLRSFALSSASVQVKTMDGVKPLVATMGVSLKKTAGYESYSEYIGVPGARLTDTYWFPWYNNSGPYVSQLCFGNVGQGLGTTIRVTIAGVLKNSFWLANNRARCVSYAALNAGPVQVKSSGGVLIVASLSTKLKTSAGFASYAEFGGLSASNFPVSSDYMFPWYNNLSTGTTSSQLRVANIGSSATTVTITVGGVAQSTTYPLAANHATLISLTNLNAGPIHVQSSAEVPISASMIVKLKNTSTYTSYTEVMGLPETSSLTETRVVFPWYNNLTTGPLVSQLRITNIGIKKTDVTVTIAGVTREKVTLLARQSVVRSYANANNGPVVLQSSLGVPIIASMITYMKKGAGYSSYSEFVGQLGLPGNQLRPSAWFPWYGNLSTGNVLSQLRFGLPAKP